VLVAASLLLTAILVAAYTAQITQPSSDGVNISQNFGGGLIGTNFTFFFRDADLGGVADAVTVNITQNGATVFTTTLVGANQDNFNFSFNTSSLADGRYNLSINMTDTEAVGTPGNQSNASFNFTIDNTKPGVTLNAPANNTYQANTSLNVYYTVNDGLSTAFNCSLQVDGALANAATASVGVATNISATVTQSNHTYRIACTDAANNTNSSQLRTVTADTTAPRVIFAGPTSGGTVTIPSAPSSIAINYTSLDNLGPSANCSVYVNGTLNASDRMVANGSTSNASISFGTGQFNVTIICSDNATNTGSNQTLFTVATASTINITSPTNGSASQTSNGTVTFVVTSGFGGTVSWRFLINRTLNFTGVGASGASVTINLSNLSAHNLDNGTYTFTAEGNDSSAQVPVNASITFIVDTVAPTITSFTLTPSSVEKGETVTGSCSATDTHSSVSTAITGISTSTTGSKTATCTATDAAGNTATSSASYTVTTARDDANGGSSGSGGTYTGGGGTATFDYDHVSTGSFVLDVEAVNNPIDTIDVDFTGAGSNVRIVVLRLTVAPSVATTPPSPAFAYLKIDHTNLPDVDHADVTFSVPESWLDDNDLASDQISLFRWETDHWAEYAVAILSTTGGNVNYRTRLPGLSYLTIAKKSGAVVTAPKTTAASTNASAVPTTSTTSPAEAPPASETPPAAPSASGEEDRTVVFVVSAAAAILVAGTILYLFFSGRPPRHHAKGGHKRGELQLGDEE